MKKDKKQELFIQDYKILLRKYYNDINVNKRNKGKLKGALVANLIKKYIEQIIINYLIRYLEIMCIFMDMQWNAIC